MDAEDRKIDCRAITPAEAGGIAPSANYAHRPKQVAAPPSSFHRAVFGERVALAGKHPLIGDGALQPRPMIYHKRERKRTKARLRHVR
jgi:hypothetical protein